MELLLEIFIHQLLDPFRIGLLLFLAVTTLRNSHATGFAIPLALGVAFVAVLIPGVMGQAKVGLLPEIAVGVVVNVAWVAALLGAWMLLRRLRGASA